MKRIHIRRILPWVFLLSLAAYAFLIEPAWVQVTRHIVGTETTSKKVRLVQLSDLHLQAVGRTERNTLDALKDIAPDVILLTGDLIDRPEGLPVLDAYLAEMQAPVKFAVLGNWEYWGGIDQRKLRMVLERHGVRLLINECVQLQIGNLILRVAGLDDFTAGQPNVGKLDPGCLGDGKNLILIQHSPGFYESVPLPPRVSFPTLSLSGHTHGGQVSLFGHAIWTPPGSGSFNRGWYDTGWGKLYVSRGVGTSVSSVRFMSRPEVAVFEWAVP